MKSIELLRMVWINMMQNKFKVILTSLGIIVGTMTIVLVIAIGQGAEQQAAAQFSGLSADTIYVNLNYAAMGGEFDFTKIERLTEENLNQIKEESTALSDIYLRAETTKEVGIGRQKEYLSIVGVTEGYADVSNLLFSMGSDFSIDDLEEGTNVAVIGNGIVEKYFTSEADALGQKIKIGEDRYEIIGVLQRNEDGLQGMNHDNSIYIPYTTVKENKILDDMVIPQIVGKAKKLNMVKLAKKEIESTLDYYLNDSDLYIVEDAGSRIDAATQSARTMKLLLVSVATIVLIVGGIGIMNVLFVTIKERTKEIGVLKALGSTSKDIMLQFLLESVSIGVFGGAVGIILSLGAMNFMVYTDLPIAQSIEGKVIAFIFAVLTSTVFGFYPAYKASQLRPVEALSYE